MKKTILAFDGRHFSEGALRMASWLNERERMLVTGIFLNPIDYREVIGYSGMGMGGAVVMPPIQDDEEMVAENIRRFEERCRHEGFEFRVHKDTDLFALQELVRESRFADLMILSSEMFYSNIDEQQPNDYLRRVLSEAECPVLLVPERFKAPDSIMLSYDGKPSSVFAIRQFAYLLPELCGMETLLIGAIEETDEELPDVQNMAELASRHFPSLTVGKLTGTDRHMLGQWVDENRGNLLVTGAFGRSEVSSLFRRSFATEIIRRHRIPIFVAHCR